MTEAERTQQANSRSSIIQEINLKLANIQSVEKRVNSAKSELGTAKHEYQKIQEEYAKLRMRLDKLLPESITASDSESPEEVGEKKESVLNSGGFIDAALSGV